MKKTWLEQKVFEFATSDGSKYKFGKKPSILVVINSVETGVPIEQLFHNQKVKLFENECDIKGYSILQFFKPTPHGLNYEDLFLKFIDTDKGQELFIFRIRNPFVQMNDEDIHPEYFDKMIDIIRAHHQAKVVSEPEVPEVAPQEVAPEPQVKLYESKKYEEEKEGLINNGYEEFSSDNYRVLMKDEHKPIVVEIKEDGDFEIIKDIEYKNGSIVFKKGDEPITIKIAKKQEL